ncbi:MAG TPA: orotidine-5'-phosphate decarboxylase [Gemmatimonadaceae bacterium]|nr:orotidine-5'-phosphate decarboxylase [Gemmatimonadaceae bacterium]
MPSVTPIVALDVPALAPALDLVRRLGDSCDFYKIGSELFTAVGPEAVRAIVSGGNRVFLDLKFHDIPNTVRSAARAAASAGASLLTVHAVGGADMLRAAVEGAGASCGVLAVTVLTSMDAALLGASWGRTAPAVVDEVVRLAGITAEAGAHGVVCAGAEAGPVKEAYGDRLAILVPGIRFAEDDAHDQRRVVTPAAAAAAGATYLVLGRAVTAAPDPAAAMRRARTELTAVSAG